MESDTKIAKKSRRSGVENFAQIFFLFFGVISVGCVLAICIYLIISGLPAIIEIGPINFLFGTEWSASDDVYGILPLILTSLAGAAGALIIAVPLGIFTAVFLAKAAPPKLAWIIRTAVELLAGIPSVIYGLIGMMVLVPAIAHIFNLSSGACLLAAILVLTIMILPYVISVSETALRAVPTNIEEGALALGASRVETWFRVVLYAGRSGVITGIVQGVGRAIGESMAVILVAGNVANMPSLLKSVRFMTTAITSGMSYAAYGSLQRQALFSIGLVLLLFILLINAALAAIKGKNQN